MTCCVKNRVHLGKEGTAQCGKCGASIYPDLAKLRASRNDSLARGPTRSKSRRGFLTRAILFPLHHPILTVAGVAGIYYYTQEPGLPRSGVSPSAATVSGQPAQFYDDAPVLPAAVPISPGLQWNRTGRSPIAPFEIVTRGADNYYVKLVDYYTDEDAVAVFVLGNSRIEVDVPLGVYRLRYASGTTWRGPSAYFGPSAMTTFSESSSMFKFDQTSEGIMGYTVELYVQADGNMATHDIGLDQF